MFCVPRSETVQQSVPQTMKTPERAGLGVDVVNLLKYRAFAELEAGVHGRVAVTCGVKGPNCGSSSDLTVVELVTATPDDGGVDGNRERVDNLKMLLSGQSKEKLTVKSLTMAQTEARVPQTNMRLPLRCHIAAVCRTDFAAENGNIAAVDVKLPLQRHQFVAASADFAAAKCRRLPQQNICRCLLPQTAAAIKYPLPLDVAYDGLWTQMFVASYIFILGLSTDVHRTVRRAAMREYNVCRRVDCRTLPLHIAAAAAKSLCPGMTSAEAS
ncbi:hypothetical protein C8R45DRAFT_940963 [Mycena sanguinolenta]|nr:hypothetical protein C8R45DRAFT_940963 [Mycena sanguinolenta]